VRPTFHKSLLLRIKGLIKRLNLSSNYLTASICLIGCMTSSIISDSILRHLASSGLKVTFILLFTQVMSILISLLLIRLFRPHFSFKPKYWGLMLFRSVLTSIAFISSKFAITIVQIPLYLSTFSALIIPAVNMLFAVILLGEKANLYGILMGVSIVLPLLGYFNMYSYSILLLCMSHTIFAFLDCSLAYMSRERKPESGLLNIFPHRGREEILLINLFEGIIVMIMYFILSIKEFSLHSINTFKISQLPFLLLMGCTSFVAMPLLFMAYSLEKVSSIQPVKSIEPILAGSFADRKNLPKDIIGGIFFFFCASLLMIYKETKINLRKKDL